MGLKWEFPTRPYGNRVWEWEYIFWSRPSEGRDKGAQFPTRPDPNDTLVEFDSRVWDRVRVMSRVRVESMDSFAKTSRTLEL